MGAKGYFGKRGESGIICTREEFETFVALLEPGGDANHIKTYGGVQVVRGRASSGWVRGACVDVEDVGKVKIELDVVFMKAVNSAEPTHYCPTDDYTHVRINANVHHFGKGARDSRTWKTTRELLDILVD